MGEHDLEEQADAMAGLLRAYTGHDRSATEAELWCGCKDAARVIDALRARIADMERELAEWDNPDSARRQGLLEETVFAFGEGQRSEVGLREGQLDAAEAWLAVVREQDPAGTVRRLDVAHAHDGRADLGVSCRM
jgi:hypothetical protein